MAKKDDSREADRPFGVPELTWQAIVAYQAVQAERAKRPEELVHVDTAAREAADKVLRGA
jgi:hypothetical protein